MKKQRKFVKTDTKAIRYLPEKTKKRIVKQSIQKYVSRRQRNTKKIWKKLSWDEKNGFTKKKFLVTYGNFWRLLILRLRLMFHYFKCPTETNYVNIAAVIISNEVSFGKERF